MGAIIAVEIVLLLLFNLWPASRNEPKEFSVNAMSDRTALVEAPIITHQEARPAAPPAPTVPVEVPNDVIIENQKIEFLEFDGAGEDGTINKKISGSGSGSPGKIYSDPTVAPSIAFIVEPTVANKTDKKALIYVRFIIDTQGSVEEATIKRILLFDDRGNPTIEVNSISQRVINATIEAAMDWKFRPAKESGKPVRATTLNTFTVDY